MGDLSNNQIVQLELVDLIHKICEEEELQYTLLRDSMVAWKEYGGFAPFLGQITIGMLYPHYLRFVDVCKEKLYGTEYYIIDEHTCEQFKVVWGRLAKRSRVLLPESRKKDEIYYDYYVEILPIYYVGNTERELRYIKKEYICYQKCVSATKIMSGTVKLKNCIKMAKRAYYYSQKQKQRYTFEKMKKQITKYGERMTKYVFIPSSPFLQKGVCCLSETYLHTQKIKFDGHVYMIIQDVEQWIAGFYNSKDYKKLISKPANRISVVGPEILRRIQLIELEMLREVDRICRKNGLKYVLYSGTLLGAVRHGGFVPWDDDIDVAMLYEDYIRFIEVAPKEWDTEKFFLKTQETDKDCNIVFAQIKRKNTVYCREGRETSDTHPGVFLDIIPFFNGSSSRIVHVIQHKICAFYKAMVWSHLGARTAVNGKLYYTLLSKVSNKTAYKKFMKWATLVKKPTDNLAYLAFIRNPYNAVHTRRKTYENIKEMEFEGFKFYVPIDCEKVLCSLYSNYQEYPVVSSRIASHLPTTIQIGDLFENLTI